jgi:hypothetical protein
MGVARVTTALDLTAEDLKRYRAAARRRAATSKIEPSEAAMRDGARGA